MRSTAVVPPRVHTLSRALVTCRPDLTCSSVGSLQLLPCWGADPSGQLQRFTRYRVGFLTLRPRRVTVSPLLSSWVKLLFISSWLSCVSADSGLFLIWRRFLTCPCPSHGLALPNSTELQRDNRCNETNIFSLSGLFTGWMHAQVYRSDIVNSVRSTKRAIQLELRIYF